MDKISVIVPVYNAEKYLSETLDSLLGQTYPNIEIICINDGSTDRSLDILKSYEKKHSNIIVLTQPNGGQSSARNKGISIATGEYINFADSDDIVAKDCLEKLYNACIETNAEIVCCGYEEFKQETNQTYYRRMPSNWKISFGRRYSHVFAYGPWAKLIKTSLIKKYNISFVVGEQLEDGPFSCILHLLANKVEVVDFIGYKYRIYSDSTTGNVKKKNHIPKPPYKGVENIIYTFDKNNQDKEYRKVMEYCVTKILAELATSMYSTVEPKYRKEICQFCHRIMKESFPSINKNEYIKINKLTKLPLTHRVAVRLFVFFDSLNLLYPFSYIVSKVL